MTADQRIGSGYGSVEKISITFYKQLRSRVLSCWSEQSLTLAGRGNGVRGRGVRHRLSARNLSAPLIPAPFSPKPWRAQASQGLGEKGWG